MPHEKALKMGNFSSKSKAIALPFCLKLAHIQFGAVFVPHEKALKMGNFSSKSKAIALPFCLKLAHIQF